MNPSIYSLRPLLISVIKLRTAIQLFAISIPRNCDFLWVAQRIDKFSSAARFDRFSTFPNFIFVPSDFSS